MKKKLKLRKQVYYVVIIIILLIIAGCWGVKKYNQYIYEQSYEYKLQQVGYTLDDTKTLISKLNDETLEYILTIRLDERLVSLVQEVYFIPSKFQEYYDYIKNNKKVQIHDVVAIINSKVNNDYYSLDLKTDMSKEEAIIVNKYYQMDSNYEPDDLVNVSLDYSWGDYGSIRVRQVVMDAFLNMWQKANAEGIYLMISSAYRSYAEQEIVYNNYKENYGEDYADSIAARPGFSEHQTGLAIDIFSKTNSNRNTFKDSDAAHWLVANAYKYGFILRYPEDKVSLTGYNYESWHFRYVGAEIASYIQEHDITFEEYYAYFLDK